MSSEEDKTNDDGKSWMILNQCITRIESRKEGEEVLTKLTLSNE